MECGQYDAFPAYTLMKTVYVECADQRRDDVRLKTMTLLENIV